MLIKTVRSYFRAEAGVAAIEFAFILPFMFLMFFGLLDVTDAVSFNRRITSVAGSVGDLVSQNRTYVTKDAILDYFKAGTLIMKPKLDTNVRITVYGFRKTGNTITLEWKIDNGKGAACSKTPSVTPGPGTFSVPTEMMGYDANALIDPTIPRNDLIITQACTVYTPMVVEFLTKNILGAPTLKLEQTIMSRPRSSLTLNCYLTGPTANDLCPKV
jgi:Flp pilus assembly protein TadG